MPASRVHIAASWDAALQRLLQQVAFQLGLPDGAAGNMQAQLHSLVLCEAGDSADGQLAAHTAAAGQQAPGSSLLVQLPCSEDHEGGSVVAAYKGRHLQINSARVRLRLKRHTSYTCTTLA